MHNQVFEHSDTLSFALLACIILYINGKQFRCSVLTYVQYSLEIISLRCFTFSCSGVLSLYSISLPRGVMVWPVKDVTFPDHNQVF